MSILFKNAHLICPEQKLNKKGWLEISNNLIKRIGTNDLPNDKNFDKIIDCKDQIIAPGIIDMRVTSGDPGNEHLENLDSLL